MLLEMIKVVLVNFLDGDTDAIIGAAEYTQRMFSFRYVSII
jgi:hypothetical protein